MESVSGKLDAKRVLQERLLSRSHAPVRRHNPIPRHTWDGPVPLSWYQDQVLRHAQLARRLAPGSLLYNESITIHRHGAVHLPALEYSLTEILRRHEAWRTTFHSVDDQLVQIVHPAWDITVPVVDLRNVPQNDRESLSLQIASEDLRRPFDLEQGPLFRLKLVRLQEDEYRLFVAAHQIILDGVSVYHVLLPELMMLYAAHSSGHLKSITGPSIQCADFGQWQKSWQTEAVLTEQFDYWQKQLQGLPQLRLPTDRVRPSVQTFRGAIRPFALSTKLSEDLRGISRRENVTLFVTMLAAFLILLYCYTGEPDIVLGTVAPTRSRSEIQHLLGYFLNPVVLRVPLYGDPSFSALLRVTRTVVLEALSHSEAPFHLLVDRLSLAPDLSRSPLYQVQFSLEPPMPALEEGWDLTPMDVESGGAKLDLYLVVDDRPKGIIGRVQYNPDLFERATVEQMIRHYGGVLEVITSNAQPKLSEFPELLLGKNLVS